VEDLEFRGGSKVSDGRQIFLFALPVCCRSRELSVGITRWRKAHTALFVSMQDRDCCLDAETSYRSHHLRVLEAERQKVGQEPK
jgi:hypothetical protein